jgi:dephospho-CoA kinase
VAAAAGIRGRGVEHIGSTAVPDLPAEDVIDLQLGVDSLADADAVRDALQDAGFPWHADIDHPWPGRYHGSADPGRNVHVQVRVVGTPGWRYALLLRDWLRAVPEARAEYLVVKRKAESLHAGDPDASGYAEAKRPWFDQALPKADAWAASFAWSPSLH